MSIFDNPEDWRLIQDLLRPRQRGDSSDSEDEGKPPVQNIGDLCNAIGDKKKSEKDEVEKKGNQLQSISKANKNENEQRHPKTMEEWQQMEKEDNEILDCRKCPEYTMKYRQSITPEDLYLQLNNRTTATSSCEDLMLEICLPEESSSADKMVLDITESEVNLSTTVYRLRLPLVHKVAVNRCKASYDDAMRKLTIKLRLNREFDYVNF